MLGWTLETQWETTAKCEMFRGRSWTIESSLADNSGAGSEKVSGSGVHRDHAEGSRDVIVLILESPMPGMVSRSRGPIWVSQ